MSSKDKFIPTGNEMISIPAIRERDAAIMGISFLHMGYKGLIEAIGDNTNPFLKPFIIIDGVETELKDIVWERLGYWIPCFRCSAGAVEIYGTILVPVGERGFVYRLKVVNTDNIARDVEVGLKGCWYESRHSINESKAIDAKKVVYRSNWNHSLVFDLRSGINIFSFAPIFEEEMSCSFEYANDSDAKAITFNMSRKLSLTQPGDCIVDFFWGFGFEEVGAATAAKEILRKGFGHVFELTQEWLEGRARKTGDIDMDRILNTNLFFNFFFASGRTLDTEELVLVTSRSSRYYVSAAYWDRDSLLWSFPAILLVDADYARGMLEYVFTRQIRNIGIHSRYIDGTVLEPGFELDELCAPVIALDNYIKHTGDYNIIKDQPFSSGISNILKILENKKHRAVDLYETFLQPTDDIITYKYLTYDNVLVWKAFKGLSDIYIKAGKEDTGRNLADKALKIEKAIWKNCTADYFGKRIFVWSLDLKGGWNIYDEPPGSLQLLPYYGFCSEKEDIYINTVDVIRSPEYIYSFSDCSIAEIGCEHAPHPWVLSIANSLLCGRRDRCRDILMKSDMDNGIACESIDEHTGECATGAAFATCAGFLAYSIDRAFGSENYV